MSRVTTALTAAAVLLLGGQYLAALLAPERLWGLHHFAFLPGWVAPAATLAGLAVTAAAFHSGLRRAALGGLQRCPPTHPAVAGLLLLCGLAAFRLLRVRHYLLGDGALFLSQLSQGQARRDDIAVRLLSGLHGALRDLPGWDEWRTMAVVSAACGVLYALSALALARRLSPDPLRQWLALACATLTGLALLFFGYPEVYAPLAAALALYGLALVLWDGHHRRWLVVASAVASVALAYHKLGGVMLPSLALAIGLEAAARNPALDRHRGALLAGLGVAVGGAAAAVVWRYPNLFLTGGTPGYAPWSAAHLSDMANILLLAAPLQLVLVAAVLARGPTGVRRHPVTLALGTLAATALGASFAFDLTLGALDWDLWSLWAVPLGVLAAWLAARGLTHGETARLLVPVTAAAALHVIPWLAVNADAGRAAPMVEAMVAKDAHHRGERRSRLAAKMMRLGQPEAARRQYAAALAADGDDPLALFYLGLLRYGDPDPRSGNGLDLLERFTRVAPPGTDTRIADSLIRFDRGQRVEGVLLCAAFLLEHGADPTGLQLALALEGATADERLREILQVARTFAAGERSNARARWLAFASTRADDAAVLQFSHDLRRALARAPSGR